jgi:hypothetical protein
LRQSRWAGVAVVACLLLLASGAGASNSMTYADATADAPSAAPDLTSVQVSNDDAGMVVFRISIPNRTAMQDPDFVAVLVDADGQSGTGCARGAFGAEYALDMLARRYVFGRCLRGGQWSFTHKPPSFSGSFAGSTLTLKANRRDLGGTKGFSFRIGSAGTGATDSAYDFAPDVGTAAWSYKVVAPPQAVKKPPKKRKARCRKSQRRPCKALKRPRRGSAPRAK